MMMKNLKSKYTYIVSVLLLLIASTGYARHHKRHHQHDLINLATAKEHIKEYTLLSDYADEKSISFGYIPKLSHEWILHANAPAIQQTKRLYDYLVNRGFHIIFLTGRQANEYEPTKKNLVDQGFKHFDKLIVRKSNEANMTALIFKSTHRKMLTEEGCRIVGCVGDQESDLAGGYAGHTVKLPNYRYLLP